MCDTRCPRCHFLLKELKRLRGLYHRENLQQVFEKREAERAASEQER